jgi:hypothetical protein
MTVRSVERVKEWSSPHWLGTDPWSLSVLPRSRCAPTRDHSESWVREDFEVIPRENDAESLEKKPPVLTSRAHRPAMAGTQPTMMAMAHSTSLEPSVSMWAVDSKHTTYVVIMELVRPTEDPLRDEYL